MKTIIDPLTEGYIHACSQEDIESLISKVPKNDLKELAFIVFHQPTRKEDVEHPRWAAYIQDYRRGSIEGPAILLEAIDPSKPIKWTTSLDPDEQKELERLEREGHMVTRGKKEIIISMDAESIRRTQLRSFLHELGHHVDRTKNPRIFDIKTKADKEHFAHKYAGQFVNLLI